MLFFTARRRFSPVPLGGYCGAAETRVLLLQRGFGEGSRAMKPSALPRPRVKLPSCMATHVKTLLGLPFAPLLSAGVDLGNNRVSAVI